MSRKLSKKQRSAIKIKNQKKKQKILEKLDIKGIKHKRHKFIINIKVLYKLKFIAIFLIVISYFFFSTFLAYIMIFYVALFYIAIGCEHQLNKSVIKSNQIKIPKYDSAIALLLVLIATVGAIFGVSQGRFGRFSNTFWSKLVSNIQNFGTLLTGQRNLFGKSKIFGFGVGQRPDGFIPDSDSFNQMIGEAPPMGGRPDFEISLDNIPIEFMFSQILSTVNTFLIFSVVGIGILSLLITHNKLKKFNHNLGEILIDGEITMLSSEELERIISYGEIE
ncbi:MAG: hypothetical protein KKH01_01100 [Firmicutes bacterium]|nr:hypothetical protein [Bacillota bacterium]